MMISPSWYKENIENYSYSELLEEQRRLFKHILELELKVVLDDCHLGDVIINPTYKQQLTSNREYLIVLEGLIKNKEDEAQEQEFRELVEEALSKRDE